MDDSITVINRYSKVQMKIKEMLDNYIKLPITYQSTVGFDILIQNVIRKEIINLMGTTIVDLDIEFKFNNNRIKHFESRLL